MGTRAFRTLDCAHKVRVRYYLPLEIDRLFLAQLPGTEVEIQEFSKMVEGAKDHFRVGQGRTWSATGVIGERLLVVTYGKFGEDDPDVGANIQEMHLALDRLYCGPVVELESKAA